MRKCERDEKDRHYMIYNLAIVHVAHIYTVSVASTCLGLKSSFDRQPDGGTRFILFLFVEAAIPCRCRDGWVKLYILMQVYCYYIFKELVYSSIERTSL